jgi:hypothetical protein
VSRRRRIARGERLDLARSANRTGGPISLDAEIVGCVGLKISERLHYGYGVAPTECLRLRSRSHRRSRSPIEPDDRRSVSGIDSSVEHSGIGTDFRGRTCCNSEAGRWSGFGGGSEASNLAWRDSRRVIPDGAEIVRRMRL